MIPGFEPGALRVDAHGRVSLTDMHRIAGGEKRNEPGKWLVKKSVLAAISRKRKSGNEETTGFEPVLVVRGGNAGGTWAAPELARLYACHLAPEHHPWHQWPWDLERFSARKFWPVWGCSARSSRSASS